MYSDGSDLIGHLASSTANGEFYFLFTGDSQYYWACTSNNPECLAAVPCATQVCSVSLLPSHAQRLTSQAEKPDNCTQQQSLYNTQAQELSLQSLVRGMAYENISPKGHFPSADHSRVEECSDCTGLIINGDLTAYGHQYQYKEYKAGFGLSTIQGIPMFPGLGNHDYQNNIRKEPYVINNALPGCNFNNCADRMVNVRMAHGGRARVGRLE